MAHRAAPISMHAPMPMWVMPIGSRKVPLAAPMRLNAAATPMPLARSSEGNSSLGYTPQRSPEIALKNEKNAKHKTTIIPGAAPQPPITASVIVITQKDVNSRGRRPVRSITRVPASAPMAATLLAAIVPTRSLEMCNVENTSGANVKIAKYGATKHAQKMHANAVRWRMPGAQRSRNRPGLMLFAREILGPEVMLPTEVLVDDLPCLLDAVAAHQPARRLGQAVAQHERHDRRNRARGQDHTPTDVCTREPVGDQHGAQKPQIPACLQP